MRWWWIADVRLTADGSVLWISGCWYILTYLDAQYTTGDSNSPVLVIHYTISRANITAEPFISSPSYLPQLSYLRRCHSHTGMTSRSQNYTNTNTQATPPPLPFSDHCSLVTAATPYTCTHSQSISLCAFASSSVINLPPLCTPLILTVCPPSYLSNRKARMQKYNSRT
jgi:hypothetical protein